MSVPPSLVLFSGIITNHVIIRKKYTISKWHHVNLSAGVYVRVYNMHILP